MNQDETEGKSETTLKKQTGVTVNYFFNGSGCRIMIPIAIGNQHSRKPWHWVQLLNYSKIVEATK